MALPFYNEADQAIYEGGQHFIPQEKYRLNYTPPAIMGQNTNTGLASTNVARPYKWPYPWPPQGGGEGAGNISGTQQRSWSPNQNLGPTNITDYEAEAYGVGPTWGGTWARAQDLYSKLPTPTNLLRRGWKGIQRWREKREIANEQKLQNEIAAHNQAAYYSGAQNRQAAADQSRIDRAYREETGGQAGSYAPGGGSGEHAADPSGSTYSDPFDPGGGEKEGGLIRKAYGGRIGFKDGLSAYQLFKLKELGYGKAGSNPGSYGGLSVLRDILKLHKYKHGGRIGYAYGTPDPEEPAEDIFEIMRDQDIPHGEQVEGDAFQMRIQELMGKGLSWDDAYDIAEMEFQDLFAEAPDSADEGLASLV